MNLGVKSSSEVHEKSQRKFPTGFIEKRKPVL